MEHVDAVRMREEAIPLAVDLDHTLLRTDTLFECVALLLRRAPLQLLRVIAAALRGRAAMKQALAELAAPEIASLPANDAFVEWLAAEHAGGRRLILATAADRRIAEAVRERFPFFADVLASDGATNLKGRHKADALAAACPEGFGYAGDSRADLPVWRRATTCVLVGASPGLARQVRALGRTEAEFEGKRFERRAVPGALRLHQWAKNALVFVPLVLGARLGRGDALLRTVLAFGAISLLASATYIVNDLLDLLADRLHWSKRRRALASGHVPLAYALAAVPVGIGAALALGALVNAGTLAVLVAYLALTLAYSLRLKAVPVVDVAALAALYTLRLGLGIAASGVPLSEWLLAVSMLLFLSLGLAKRFTEIERLALRSERQDVAIPSRGYRVGDGPFVLALGSAAAMAAVALLVVYVGEEALATGAYRWPAALWSLPVIVFLWLARLWLLASRGQMHDDPIAFALRDRQSLGHAGALGLAVLAGLHGMPFA